MIRFEASAELKKLENWLKDLAGKQLPFVVAKTLTDLAKEIQREVVKDFKTEFKTRNDYVARSFRIKMAQKRDFPNCVAEVGSVYEPMELQETGGVKKPKKEEIPLGAPLLARKTKSDIIPQKLWVRKLLDRAGYYKFQAKDSRTYMLKWNKTGRKVGCPKGIRTKHGMEKPRPARNPNVDVMYRLSEGMKINPKLGMYEKACAILDARRDEVFRKNLEEALR